MHLYWEVLLWVLHSKEFKGHDLRLNNKGIYEFCTFNTSRLTAVETNYICTYLRYFVTFSHTDCKLLLATMEIDQGLPLFPHTSIFFSRNPYISFEICNIRQLYYFIFANVNNLSDWPILTSVESGRSPQAEWAEMAKHEVSCRLSFPWEPLRRLKQCLPTNCIPLFNCY